MSLTKEAIQHIEKNAKAGESTETYHDGIILPEGYKLQDLEEFQQHRNHYRVNYVTHRIESFADYYKGQAAVPVYVSQDCMRALAVFDMGTPEAPDHCLHTAKLTLKETPEYVKIQRMIQGGPWSQQEMAEFVEDYHTMLTCGGSNGEEISIKKAISAFRRVTIDKESSGDKEVTNYSQKMTAMEKIQASSGGLELPAYLAANVETHYGLSPRSIKMRASMIMRNEPMFKLRDVNLENVMEAAADEFVGIIKKDVSAQVFIGALAIK